MPAAVATMTEIIIFYHLRPSLSGLPLQSMKRKAESHFEILYCQQIIYLILKFFEGETLGQLQIHNLHTLPIACKRLKYILCIISKNLKVKIFKYGTDRLGFGGQIWTLPFINLAYQITLKSQHILIMTSFNSNVLN